MMVAQKQKTGVQQNKETVKGVALQRNGITTDTKQNLQNTRSKSIIRF